ncbi:MAG: hypothetical protein WD928_05595 [Gammaproteobacteria bacterium]
MKTHSRYLGTAAIGLLLAVLNTGCEREGPAERAGKEVDRAASDVGQALEEAGDDIKDATN